MAFVFKHVTCLGLPAMSQTALSGNRLNLESCSLEEEMGGGNPSQLTALTSDDNSGRGLTCRLHGETDESLERC